jgi:hypothetical protein
VVAIIMSCFCWDVPTWSRLCFAQSDHTFGHFQENFGHSLAQFEGQTSLITAVWL